MSEELAGIIREEIRQKGPIPFRRWMELCLYHPEHGYYMKPRRAGRRITGPGPDADFVTPPTLHPFFARAVAAELRSVWEADGRPASFKVVEYGGGEGDLARGAVAALAKSLTGLAWLHVEPNPDHRQRQGDADVRIQQASDGEGGDAGVFCEVLDAVPADAYSDSDSGPVHVAAAAAGFRPVAEVAVLDGEAAARWLAQRCRPLRHALVIDYGQAGPASAARAYHGHRNVDCFESPGDHDITVPVDFRATARAMEKEGFRLSSFESMESFLLRHGILEELNAIDRATLEGASSYLRLRQLLLPTGMGAAFKVQRFDRE